MGNSYGPVLIESVVGSFELLLCLRAQDTYVYSAAFGYPCLPDIPCDCPLEAPSGVEDLSHAGRPLLISPNPASGSLYIQCPQLTSASKAQLRLFDTIGRVVVNTNLQGPLNELDVSELKGVFTVVVDTERARLVESVVIE
jgi:hypothetical protein